MAVPKKKTPKGQTRTQHKAYVAKQVKKIKSKIHTVKCTNCGADKLNHFACPACGFYNGRQVIDMTKKIDNITTVKA